MQVSHELRYDASPDTVFDMLADPGFRQRVCEAMGVVSSDVRIDRSGTGFTLVNDQVQRTDGLPSFARKFAGDTTQAIQREEWPDPTGGTLRIETPGKPTSMSGTIRLEADGRGTVETVSLDIKAKVPLIGGRLERLMADQVSAGIEAEQGVGRQWLSERA